MRNGTDALLILVNAPSTRKKTECTLEICCKECETNLGRVSIYFVLKILGLLSKFFEVEFYSKE